MNSEELKTILDELDIPVRCYSINGNIGSNKYIFRQVYNYWECFYIDERGNEKRSKVTDKLTALSKEISYALRHGNMNRLTSRI